jgi:thymidylate kinase
VTAPEREEASRPHTIALVRELCAQLAAERVSWCHFKSNTFLDRSRTGENDLDLLIARADEERFSAAMHRLGFKLARRRRRGLPGVLDYYGRDGETGRAVHVHAHYQLVVGDDLTKGYRLPVEAAFLGSARPDGEFLVPPPELELILLVIRLTLKHLTWDAVVTRRARIPASARSELADLEGRAETGEVKTRLEQALPFIGRQTFEECRLALAPDAGQIAGIRAGGRLLADLTPCARRSRAADVGLKFWRRGGEIAARLASRPAPPKQPVAGGAIIAIVGADGAGKSTAVEELGKRLGKTFGVVRAHLGKPPKSWTTRALRNIARGRSAYLLLAGRLGRPAPSRATEHAVLATALARDRYLTVRRIRRIATNGVLVLCDRFPLRELKLMDGPRVERVRDPNRWRRLTDRLAARERRYYQAITPPDVLIVLLVDPEIAVVRQSTESADSIRSRWREVWSVDWDALPAHVVDAGQPREAVLSRLESLIWSEI